MPKLSSISKKFREIKIENDIESVNDTVYIKIQIDRVIKSTK